LNERLIRDITTKVLREITKQTGGANTQPLQNPNAYQANMASPTLCENNALPIPIGVSARHLHLCRKHMDILFGTGSQLTFYKELMGGQFAAAETITIVGRSPDTILKARVLGPLRDATQVEISATDARALGISAPLRDSGNVSGSAGITIVGPNGAIYLDEGCIVARRHIHMSPADAVQFNVNDKDIVNVCVGGQRGGTISNVLVRVDASFTLEMHIDTDEANALGITTGDLAHLS